MQFVWFLIINIIHNKKPEGVELGARERRLGTHQPPKWIKIR